MTEATETAVAEIVERLLGARGAFIEGSTPYVACTEAATALEAEHAARVKAEAEARTLRNAGVDLLNRAEAAERDTAQSREALKPFASILVFSFEDEPESIHVTYDGQTLAVLDLDSAKGTAALKLEHDLAIIRALLQGEPS